MINAAPPKHVRCVACIIWLLSRRPDLGAAYMVTRRRRYRYDYDLTSSVEVALQLAAYLEDPSLVNRVEEALLSIDDKRRIIADTFLMQTLLVDYIVCQNGKGVVLDLDQVITKYIGLWACRPMSTVVERRLARFVWHRNERRHFGVTLRREWALTISSFSTPRELPIQTIQRRVFSLGS